MANDNYPNGWKDGQSSVDMYAENGRSYSPAELEREKLRIKGEKEKNENSNKNNNTYSTGSSAYLARNDREIAAHTKDSNRTAAINIIVEEERQKWKKKSAFGKFIAKLGGNSFKTRQGEIEENAINKVNNMSDKRVAEFVEEHNKGRR